MLRSVFETQSKKLSMKKVKKYIFITIFKASKSKARLLVITSVSPFKMHLLILACLSPFGGSRELGKGI